MLVVVVIHNIVNPMIAFIVSWSLTLGLYGLNLTENIIPISDSTLYLVLGGFLSSVLLLAFDQLVPVRLKNNQSLRQVLQPKLPRLKRIYKFLMRIWSVGTAIEIVLFRGFPLLWILQRSDKDYTKFGVPTLHGLLNGFFFFCGTIAVLIYILDPKRKKRSLLIFVVWPMLILGRGILLGVVCQMVAVWLVVCGLSVKRLWQGMLLVAVAVLGFGIIGDTRGTPNPFKYLIREPYVAYFDAMPSGPLWFYVYVTSPLANLSNNSDHLKPDFVPNKSVITLLPSVIYNRRGGAENEDVELVDSNLNVSTFYINFVSDFGVFLTILLTAFLQIFCLGVYRLANRGNFGAIIAYAPLFQCIVFSVFYNLFFLQTYVIQVMLGLMIGLDVRFLRNRGVG